MRTRIARTLVVCALCVLGVRSSAVAQERASATIGVRAEIVASIGITGTNNLNFGQIVATAGGSTARVDKASPDAGRFEVRGSGDESIQITFTAPSRLTRSSGAGTLGIQLELYGSTSGTDASSARRLVQGETVRLSDGQYFFYVGGDLNVGSVTLNPPGSYTGEFELEVVHANL